MFCLFSDFCNDCEEGWPLTAAVTRSDPKLDADFIAQHTADHITDLFADETPPSLRVCKTFVPHRTPSTQIQRGFDAPFLAPAIEPIRRLMLPQHQS